jgi:hypothetical protein
MMAAKAIRVRRTGSLGTGVGHDCIVNDSRDMRAAMDVHHPRLAHHIMTSVCESSSVSENSIRGSRR